MSFLYEKAIHLIKNKINFIYITLYKQNGSSPRSKGAKMIVTQNEIFDTIGGGAIENELIELSRKTLIPNHASRIKCFDMSGKDVLTSEFICGGYNEFLLHYMDYNNCNALEVFKDSAHQYKKRSQGYVITILSKEEDPSILEFNFTTSLDLLDKRYSNDSKYQVIIDQIHPTGMVYLFGGGHVSKEVAKLTAMTDFFTTIIDDREEYANKESFPNSEVIVISDFNNLNNLNLMIDDNAYIIIITRGHTYDRQVLEWALSTKAYYIGMIGSKPKRNAIYDYLIENGFKREALAKVHSPIGLSIGAQTPSEIAVSIVGELIEERAKSRG